VEALPQRPEPVGLGGGIDHAELPDQGWPRRQVIKAGAAAAIQRCGVLWSCSGALGNGQALLRYYEVLDQ
jgi:hypothetical protein